MAIGRISGEMLLPNLERDGVDLALDTDLLYFDVTKRRIGIRTFLPGVTFTGTLSGGILTVTGTSTPGPILVGMTIAGDTGVTGVVADTKIVSAGSAPATWNISQTYAAPVTGKLIGQIAPNFNFVVGANTRITDTTDSTSCDTGALVVDGGVGIAKTLNVCGDIFVRGQRVLTSVGGAKRKLYSFDIPALAVGEVFLHTAKLGYANIVYNLSILAPVQVEIYGTPTMDEPNPYNFLATDLRLVDDGTTYFADGTLLKTRQYSMLANLETPATSNLYFKITGIGDVFGGTPLSNLAPAKFSGYIVGTDLFVVGGITGRMIVGMSVTVAPPSTTTTTSPPSSGTTTTTTTTTTTAAPGSSIIDPSTKLTQFVGQTWKLNSHFIIGSATDTVVMTATYHVPPSPPRSVSFYGYISGFMLVITTGLSASLVAKMRLTSTDPTVFLAPATELVEAIGSIWKITPSQTVADSSSPIGMQAQVLVNTLSMIYIDEASDSGSLSTNVVSALPSSGYNGQTVYRSTDNTYWVFSKGLWNQI
jgi:hypothetical protein